MTDQLNENAQTNCLKCGITDDVANMKPDGHGKFLCIECAYETLEKATETLSAENRTLEENITSLLRHGSFMEYRGRCEQFLYCRLCDSKWLWENDEPSEHKETCLYLLRDKILEGKDDRAT